MTELYKKYRPNVLKDLVGQSTAVAQLQQMIDQEAIPHALLFTGPSGCGKTTVARILRKHLQCSPREFREYDIGDIRGVDNIRDIRHAMLMRPLEGKSKVYFLDEIAEATSTAQKALLKSCLEDTPSHVWFMLATTDPHKLIKPIRTRCTEVALGPLKEKDLIDLATQIATAEKRQIEETILSKVAELAEGSARKALVLLESVLPLADEDAMMETLNKMTMEPQAIQLCRLLLRRPPQWKPIAALLRELEEQDAEGLRRMVLGYMRGVVLGGNQIAPIAFRVMCSFEKTFYDSGHAGLAMACWEAANPR